MNVLFLCTGNYFRSRYAEIWFNHRARELGLAARAGSAGLAIERGVNNVGPMARVAVERLARRGIRAPETERAPWAATAELLAAADRIIALKETEHRPLVLERHPDFAARVEYWHVDDVDCATADAALDSIDVGVDGVLLPAVTALLARGLR